MRRKAQVDARAGGLAARVCGEIRKASELEAVGRLRMPEENAEAVLWTASGASGFVTGAATVIDADLSP